MAEFKSQALISEGEKHMFVACHHVVRALRAYNYLDANLSKLLADLDSHLSTMTVETKTEDMRFVEVEERFKGAEKKILSCETNQSMIWDAGPSEAARYLQAVYEIQTILSSLKGLPVNANRKQKDVYNRATMALDTAMARLEKELCDVLDQHKQHVEPRYMAISSRREDIVYDESFISLEDEVVGEASHRDGRNRVHKEHNADLVHPHVVPHIKAIANIMFTCDYGQEFCEAFIGVRRRALDEYLATLEIERFSCEDVFKMEWEDLNSAMRKWAWILKMIIHVYLASEKQLCEQILGDFQSVYPFCFVEISKDTVLSLQNFGEAVVMGSCKPEKLERLLGMCEASTDILLDVDNLFSEETGSYLRIAFHELSKKLGDCARVTFLKFKDAIASDASSRAFPGGGIHHLTRYVMNYFRLLPAYSDTLNSLLRDLEVDDAIGIIAPEKTGQDVPPSTFSPVASHLRSIASMLEASLYRKSQLYEDDSLRYIFLVNNFHYMVQKVMGSELRLIFGDEWIRKHIAQYQHNATNYERATWSSVLSLLRDDDSRAVLRERCRLFGLAFENVHRNQTRWSVPDPQLREDLRISTSVKVIQSYRRFLGRNAACIGEKHIRYTCEDVQNLLLDLFEGSPRSLRNSRRR